MRQSRAAVNTEGKKMFEILLEKTVGTPDEKTRVSTVVAATGGKPTGSKLASKLAQTELLAKLGSAFEELDGRHLAMKMTDATFNQLGLSPFDSDKGDFLVVDPTVTPLEIVTHGPGGAPQYKPVGSLDKLNVGNDFVAFLHNDEEVHCRVLARLGYMSNETTVGIGSRVLPGMPVRSHSSYLLIQPVHSVARCCPSVCRARWRGKARGHSGCSCMRHANEQVRQCRRRV